MIQPPCKGCTERNPVCHSECEGYKAWKAEREAEKEASYPERLGKSQYKDYRNEVFRKNQRRKH